MLNGIEVLNESYVPLDFPTDLFLGYIVCLTLVVIFCWATIKLMKDGIVFGVVVFGVLTMLSFFLFIACFTTGLKIEGSPSDIKQYQVTIDESVSMVEFNERYKVIEVDGKIYTIVEKEKEENDK